MLFLLLLSVTAYAQKKGKLALPQIEKTANKSTWENSNTKQIYWVKALNKKQIDSIMGTSFVITSTEKPIKTFKKKS